MEWNNKELRRLVLNITGEDKDKFESSMSSVQWKLQIARRSQEKCFSLLRSNGDHSQLEIAKMATKILFNGASETELDIINTIISDSELYVISFAQAMHSIPDILSHVIFHALEIEKHPKYGGNKIVNIWNIRDFLIKNEIHPFLLKKIKKLEGCKEWQHLNEFTNVTKHQKVVGLTSHVKTNWDDGVLDIEICSFIGKKNTPYPSISINEFLNTYYQILGDLYLEIGQSINREAEIQLSV